MIVNSKTTWDNEGEENEFSNTGRSTNTQNNAYGSVDSDDELTDDELNTDDELDEEDWDADDDLLDDADIEGAYPGEKQEARPDEIPEKHVSEHESSEYPNETEYEKQDGGNDASYSEQTDVTPPTPHEFPSVGAAQTDFVSRPHGRTTGRMVGHEPGTEGI